MPSLYVPLSVNYSDDDKILSAGPFAELVYVRSLALVKRQGTDGEIRNGHIRRLVDGLNDEQAAEAIKNLCEQDLWRMGENGYLIVAWLRHNHSQDELAAARAAEAERKRDYRHRPAGVLPDTAGTGETSQADENSVPDSEVKCSESEVKERARVPTGKRAKRGAATAIPDPFVVSDEMKTWVKRKFPDLDWVAATEKWVDSMKAKDYRYVDWTRAWQTGMRNAQEWRR